MLYRTKPKGLRKKDSTDEDEPSSRAMLAIQRTSIEKTVKTADSKDTVEPQYEIHDPVRERLSKRRVEIESEKEAAAMAKRSTHDPDAEKLKPMDGVYRGQSGYRNFNGTKESISGRSIASAIRASTNVRNSVRFDYQPHVCKDYKETGYCGFGDSCIFLHDRGDYKLGWELDKEWQAKDGKLDTDPQRFVVDDCAGDSEDGTLEQDDAPLICPICTLELAHPVMAKCKHYFCEKCALSHHAKSHKCFVCRAATQGQFTMAKDLEAKLREKRQKMESERLAMQREMEEQVIVHTDDDEET